MENCPNAETYVMLSDAYMSIEETELAIDAYEQALKLNSKDNNLVCKMGKALVKTHHFTKAINFYKESVPIKITKTRTGSHVASPLGMP